MKSITIAAIALISNASAVKVQGWVKVDLGDMDHQKIRTEQANVQDESEEPALVQTDAEDWATVKWDGMDKPQRQRVDEYIQLGAQEQAQGWTTVSWNGMDKPQQQRKDEYVQLGEQQQAKDWVTVNWNGMDKPQQQRKDEYVQLNDDNNNNLGWRLVETKGIDQQRPRFDNDLSLVPHETSLLETEEQNLLEARPIGLLQRRIQATHRTDSVRLAQLQAMEDPEYAVHHAFNNLGPYDREEHPIFPESDHFSYNHMNHYDEGSHPIMSEQQSVSMTPV